MDHLRLQQTVVRQAAVLLQAVYHVTDRRSSHTVRVSAGAN